MSNCNFIDRRQSVVGDAEVAPAKQEARAKQEAPFLPVDVTAWKDVCYCIAMAQAQDGSMIIMGRAVGLRTDGMTFVADYWFSQLWPKNLDWTKAARERLDTFLGCECSVRSPCSVHRMTLPEWMRADEQRLTLAASGRIPEALEAYMRAEQAARSSKIVLPR